MGVERTGAPIQAFLRVAKDEILNRSNIYNPNLVVVFDETKVKALPIHYKTLEYFENFVTENILSKFKVDINNLGCVDSFSFQY